MPAYPIWFFWEFGLICQDSRWFRVIIIAIKANLNISTHIIQLIFDIFILHLPLRTTSLLVATSNFISVGEATEFIIVIIVLY